jgi:tetratricopeptide (TPR) repeat protein
MRIFTLMLVTGILFSGCSGKSSRSKEYMSQGITVMYESRFDEALALFEKAIKLDPDSYEAYYHFGNCLYNMSRHQEAMEAYNKSISINPSFADAFYNRGLLKEMFGDKPGSCEDYKKAEELGKPNISDKTRFCW